MEVLEVKIEVCKETDGDLADSFYQICVFCDKMIKIGKMNAKSCSNLSHKFYCPFCLRNNFHYRSSKNVLILSFRAIVGHMYYKLYFDANPTEMWISEIHHMIDRHIRIGLQNPTFSYDPFTMLWFVDFNKIGVNRAPYSEVECTLENILGAFNLNNVLGCGNVNDNVLAKFQSAMKTFYEKRQRPKGRRMLIPTLSGIVNENKDHFEMTREFVSTLLVLK